MSKIPTAMASRRRFIQTVGATTLVGFGFPALGAVGANNRVRLGLIGCGWRGGQLFKEFNKLPDIEFVAIADPDTACMDKVAAMAPDNTGAKLARHVDYRKLLEQPDIDAVVIASPNHWHALHMIHACQAGKDVYVEKPVSRHIGEHAMMLAAEKAHGRIVQAGTQNRSETGLKEAFDAMRAGELGKILSARGLCYRNRDSIGKIDTPLVPPSTINYDLWLGPAEDQPILRPKLHYDWHWDYNTGNGDMGNQGPHELDLISMCLGDPEPPKSMRAFGGRFAWNDAGNSANLHTSWFELAGVPVIFEVNNLWVKPGTNAAPAFKSLRVGVIITCEKGEFRGGRGGGQWVSPDGKERLRRFAGDGGSNHQKNFIEAVRSRRAEDLAAPLWASCRSAMLSHMANISYRAGTPAAVADIRAALPEQKELHEVLDTQIEHLGRWEIDPEKTRFALGAEVTADPATATLTGPLAGKPVAAPVHRKGYEIPEKA
jgi:predicted dehydrogenase